MISPGSSRAISAASADAVAFGDAEFAGRDVDPGQREAVSSPADDSRARAIASR